MDDLDSLTPLRYYEETLAPRHRANAAALWDKIAAAAKVDVDENERLVGDYDRSRAKELAADLRVQSAKTKRFWTWLGIFALLGLSGLSFCAYCVRPAENGGGSAPFLWIALLALLALAAGIVCLKRIVQPQIEELEKDERAFAEKTAEVKERCQETLTPLNALFDEDHARLLVMKTFPELKIEPRLASNWTKTIKRVFGNFTVDSDDVSALEAVGGSINDNPFAIFRRILHTTIEETYYGYSTIRWREVETYYDSAAKRYRKRIVRRSQTLSASVDAPAPKYDTFLMLAYCNSAAPDLTFSRHCSHVEQMNEKDLEAFLKTRGREIDSLAKEAVEKSTSFTPLTNAQFDRMFYAVDRSDPVQFRLMFTPLCETNLTDLMLRSPYGDDFSFRKRGKVNLITAEHCDEWRTFVPASDCANFSYEDSREQFIRLHEDYFKKLYFLLAPILAVPLYAQTKTQWSPEAPTNEGLDCSKYEAEILANLLSDDYTPKSAGVKTIRKASPASNDGTTCVFTIRQFTFSASKKKSTFSKRGGDGRYHRVSVDWIEYLPVVEEAPLYVRKSKLAECQFRAVGKAAKNVAFCHGLVGSARLDALDPF